MNKDIKKFLGAVRKQVSRIIEKQIYEELRNAKKIHPHAKEVFLEIKRSVQGGKYIRPAMLLMGYLAGRGKKSALIYRAAAALELLHLSVLVHDDIIDKARVRRFKPTTAEFFAKKLKDRHLGLSSAILVGNLARFLADDIFLRFLQLSNITSQRFMASLGLYTELKKEVDIGQYLDMRLSRSYACTEKFLEIVWKYKTAKYSFEKPLIIGATLAGVQEKVMRDLRRFSLLIGKAFQVQDDILGVFGQKKDVGKSTSSDIHEGKKTILVVYAFKKANGNERTFLKSTIGNHKANYHQIEKVKKIFIATGAYNKAKEKSFLLIKRAQKTIIHSVILPKVKNLLLGFCDQMLNKKL